MRLGRPGLRNHHPSSDILPLHTAQQETRVIASTRLVAGFFEGFNIRDLGFNGRCTDLPHQFNFTVLLQCPSLNSSAGNRAAAGNGEDVFDGHQEGLFRLALGCRDPRINGIEQLVDLLGADLRLSVLEGTKSGAEHDGCFITVEAVGAECFTHFHLDKLEHFLVFDRVDLVDENDDSLDADLASEQEMFSSLGPATNLLLVRV